MEEKRWRTDEAIGPSRLPEKLEPKEKRKAKVLAFKLVLDIEQCTNMQKVFEEWILDSRVEFLLQ